MGKDSAFIRAVATASIGALSGYNGMKPWAIPDSDYKIGDRVILKSGSNSEPGTTPGWYYPVQYPAENPDPGGAIYGEKIVHGIDDLIKVGDMLRLEKGDMIGPTMKGVAGQGSFEGVMNLDPYAYWDENTNQVLGSRFIGSTSPRIGVVPFFDYITNPLDPSDHYITVTRFGAFFIEGIVENNKDGEKGNVFGRFIQISTSGSGVGEEIGGANGVHLIQ
jgi:hypothetical protein